MQAWKVVIPPERERAELRTHEGYEWLYVLAGELRLILGDHDITMRPGEVAEFDTRLPHWFGPAGDQPVEILSLLGRAGRAHPRPRRAPPQENQPMSPAATGRGGPPLLETKLHAPRAAPRGVGAHEAHRPLDRRGPVADARVRSRRVREDHALADWFADETRGRTAGCPSTPATTTRPVLDLRRGRAAAGRA